MRITKEGLYEWASAQLDQHIADHTFFRSGVAFINLFFSVFPETQREFQQEVRNSLVEGDVPEAIRANFALLRYLLKSLTFPVDVFEFEFLEQNKRKQTLGLLIAMYFVHSVRQNVDEPMEFEVSITQRVCDFL